MDNKVWVGIDAGKEVHWAHVLDASGTGLLSRRVENDEADLLKLIDEVLALSEEPVWAVDQPGDSAALLLALLGEGPGGPLLPGPGRRSGARGLPRGIQDRCPRRLRHRRAGPDEVQPRPARSRRGRPRRVATPARPSPGSHRRPDPVHQSSQGRPPFPLPGPGACAGPENAKGALTKGALTKGALILVRHYQTPGAIRRVGLSRLTTFLKNRGVKEAEEIARKALTAASAQSVALPAEDVAGRICAELAQETLALKEGVAALDRELGQRFFARTEARILSSLPGMGPILGAEFLVSVGDLCAFKSADQLVAYAGLVPAAQDSGKRVGNHRRMRGGNKVLKRAFYQSAFARAFASLRSSPHSRAFYDRKRREG